jgi:hypothetical protein
MKLLHVGFFRELRHGEPEGPSLIEAIRPKADYDRRLVVSYLRSSPILFAYPGVVRDVLDSSRLIIGAGHIRTDGVWAWPEDLAYYVEHYNVALPSEFLEHVKLKVDHPPTEAEINFAGLEL